MQLSDLDGFLTGIMCSSVSIPTTEWLPKAVGGPECEVPREIIDIILCHYSEIATCIVRAPPTLEPILWETKEGHVDVFEIGYSVR